MDSHAMSGDRTSTWRQRYHRRMKRILTIVAVALIITGCSSTAKTTTPTVTTVATGATAATVKPTRTVTTQPAATTAPATTANDPAVNITDFAANAKRCAAVVATTNVITHNDYLACENYGTAVPIITCADGSDAAIVAINDQGYLVTVGKPATKIDENNPPATC